MVKRLVERFGFPSERPRDPVETLILTILSQNTNDTNRDRAYASLREEFPAVSEIAKATEDRIADAIRVGGLQKQKARSIREALRRISVDGGPPSLARLAEMSDDEALSWLLRLPGVGHKTAGIVLLFSFGRPYFPVDTHIRRVLTRVGWIQGREDPHRRLNVLLPKDPKLMRALHLLLIRLGRTLCRPRNPNCNACPIIGRCTYGMERTR